MSDWFHSLRSIALRLLPPFVARLLLMTAFVLALGAVGSPDARGQATCVAVSSTDPFEWTSGVTWENSDGSENGDGTTCGGANGNDYPNDGDNAIIDSEVIVEVASGLRIGELTLTEP